jgi:hypothetical protein
MIGYSPAWNDLNRAAGNYVGRILKGANPSELPFQMSNRFELAIKLADDPTTYEATLRTPCGTPSPSEKH